MTVAFGAAAAMFLRTVAISSGVALSILLITTASASRSVTAPGQYVIS